MTDNDKNRNWHDDPRFNELLDQVKDAWTKKGEPSLRAALESGLGKRFPESMITEAIRTLRGHTAADAKPANEQPAKVKEARQGILNTLRETSNGESSVGALVEAGIDRGFRFNEISDALKSLVEDKLVEEQHQTVRLTAKGHSSDGPLLTKEQVEKAIQVISTAATVYSAYRRLKGKKRRL